MEARAFRGTLSAGRLLLLSLFFLANSLISVDASQVRTQNFIVLDAPSPQLARQVSEEAERFRKELALKWLGKELPTWERPCTLRIVAGNIPAQGVTQYQRYPGYVSDFQMEVIGTPQRILDSVLPHEITHTVLATHFGQPLPRWADEGISTTVEHLSERSKHEAKLREFLTTRRGIPMNRMFMMKDYPPEMLTLYAQGYSVCRFMIDQKGPREFVKFLETFMQIGSWTESVQKHYDYESLAELQQYWLAWVESGSGDVERFVRNAPSNAQPGSTNGDVLLASGQNGKAADPPSMMLAAANSSNALNNSVAAGGARNTVGTGSWYAQVRDGKVDASSRSTQITSATQSPQSYSAAQPQPEQGAITPLPAGPSSPWTAQPARIYR